MVVEDTAATTIEAAFRGKRGRLTGKQRRKEVTTRTAAATKIEAVYRGKRGRREGKRAKQRKAVAALPSDAEAVLAATKIEAVVRGRRGRKRAQTTLATGEEAVRGRRKGKAAPGEIHGSYFFGSINLREIYGSTNSVAV